MDSVIIPAFRAEGTIARAVASALAEGAEEVIVVADDLADYAPVLRAAGLDGTRVRHLSTGRTGAGPGAARNLGLEAARGALVAWLDADDVFLPGRRAALASIASKHGAAADNVRVVDEATGTVLSHLFPRSGGTLSLDAAAFLATSVPLMAVVRRELDVRWDAEIRLGEDVAYNLRLIDRLGALPVTAAPFHEYRVRHGSICHAEDSAAVAERGYLAMKARLEGDGFGFRNAAVRRLFIESLARKIALNREFEEARLKGEVSTFQEFIAIRK